MRKLITLAALALLAVSASAQVPSSASETDGEQSPIYRVTIVGRSTLAVNYRPRNGDTKIDLVGTVLMPHARGVADVSGNRGNIEIAARLTGLQPAPRFGPEFLTYVMWAITPEGRARNLGEVQIDDSEASLEATTELQAFALIVTAEPYFAVSQPSDVVVLENVVRDGTSVAETIPVKFQLLPRGTYVMDAAARRPLEPGASLDLAQARHSVELARVAGADRYAQDTFADASRLLADAEVAGAKQSKARMTTLARQAVQTAEDSRLIAVRRQQEEVTERQQQLAAQQQRVAAQREQEANQRVEAADAERRQAQTEVESAAVARAAAERERIEAEREREESRRAQLAAEETRTEAESAKKEAEVQVEEARLEAARAQAAAQAEAQQSRLQALRAQAAAAVAEQEKNAVREQLREQLDLVLETRETAGGLIMDVPDVLFVTGSATLTAEAREKLARVGGILAALPGLHVAAEGHADSVGDAESNLRLSERRAAAVLAYMVEQKIPITAVDTAGFGETRPLATNETATGRRQNRRVELVVTGESIGRVARSDAGQ